MNLDLGLAAPLVEQVELELFGTTPPSSLFHFHMGLTCQLFIHSIFLFLWIRSEHRVSRQSGARCPSSWLASGGGRRPWPGRWRIAGAAPRCGQGGAQGEPCRGRTCDMSSRLGSGTRAAGAGQPPGTVAGAGPELAAGQGAEGSRAGARGWRRSRPSQSSRPAMARVSLGSSRAEGREWVLRGPVEVTTMARRVQ